MGIGIGSKPGNDVMVAAGTQASPPGPITIEVGMLLIAVVSVVLPVKVERSLKVVGV